MKESRFLYENVEFIFQHLENDHVAKNWNRGTFYETQLLELIRDKELKGTYVDVGSHQGNHTVYFSKVCNAEKVVAVEGSPYNFSFLESNLILNNCSNVLAHNLIASNENDVEMELFFNPMNTGNTSAYDFRNSNEKTINKSIKLDDLLVGENVSLIKLDIQDMEWFALDGCRNIIKKNKPMLIIEWNESNQHLSQINQLLQQYGYKLNQTLYVPSLVHIYEA